MDWLRCKVSGKRNRYKDDDYNLDITYITDRIIAMSFPASGFEQCYRNNIGSVSRFLEKRHAGNYIIYNLSNRTYNYNKFKGKVISYEWDPIFLLFKICYDMYKYLLNPNNVVVVHWNAGKGRTGTSIAWFLIYSGLSNNSQDAIRYYGRKRFSTGLGITQPSQIRYVRYFELVYKRVVCSPSLVVLKQVKMHTIPHINGKSWKPFLELVSLSKQSILYTGRNDENIRAYKDKQDNFKTERLLKNHRTEPKILKKNEIFNPESQRKYQNIEETKNPILPNNQNNFRISLGLGGLQKLQGVKFTTPNQFEDNLSKDQVIYDLAPIDTGEDVANTITLPQRLHQLLTGDVLMKIKHKGAFSNSLVCRIWFNTSFIYNSQMKYTIKDLDPVSIRKNDKYDDAFAITLITEPFWKHWNSKTPINEFWKSCKINLEKEIHRWEKINKIMDLHTAKYNEFLNFKSACEFHFSHSKYNDYLEVLKKDDDFRKQSFRWPKGDWGLEQLINNSDSEDSQISGSEWENEKEFSNELFSQSVEEWIGQFNEIKLGKIKSQNSPIKEEFNLINDYARKKKQGLPSKKMSLNFPN